MFWASTWLAKELRVFSLGYPERFGEMMKRNTIAVALLLVVGTIMQDIGAAVISGNKLLNLCGDNQPAVQSGFCVGYVVGVVEMMAGPQWRLPNPMACIPKDVLAGRLVGAVKKYLTDHPAELHYGAYALVVIALAQAFPCDGR
jgi:Ssp1 endopeptidase immunity protein Rap1a